MKIKDTPPQDIIKLAVPFIKQRYKDGKDNEYVYFAKSNKDGIVKIGVTKNIKIRFIALRNTNREDYQIVVLLRGNRTIESLFHRIFQDELRYGREWFECSNRMEETIKMLRDIMDRRYTNIMNNINSNYSKHYDTAQLRNTHGYQHHTNVIKSSA